VDDVWLTAPAYALADGAARDRAIAAAAAVFAPRRVVPSPLLDRHPGPGAWLPAADRLADLRCGLGHGVLAAARGGYGCLDLADAVLAHPGPWPRLVGYSDLTVLHAAFWCRGRRDGIYGFLAGVPHGAAARASTRALLAGEAVRMDPYAAPQAAVLVPGRAEGPCFPACLRVLAGLAGTPLQPSLAGCVVLLEDIDERPYRMDRDLWQLHRSGMLDRIAGLAFGRFPAEDPAGYAGPSAAAVAAAWAQRLGVPALFGLPFGHDPDPVGMPVGGRAVLAADGPGWSLEAWP
jgi:muramoyltetrapeptide carboxypeptidase